MMMHYIYNKVYVQRWMAALSFLVGLLWCIPACAQIKIGGNVYGGGNAGDTGGGTEVVVRSGDFTGSIYGGARQADVAGSSFVHIDGQHISGDITINAVYGGNDISGNIGASDKVPTGMTLAAGNGITSEYNAFVLTTPERTVTTTTGEGDGATTSTSQPYAIFIGQLFGGGNGDYDYTSETLDGKANPYLGKTAPVLGKTYLELRGGTFGYVYGGGNNATITGKTDICIDNSSTPAIQSNGLKLTFAEAGSMDGVTKLENISTSSTENPHDARLLSMGINLSTYQPGYQFLRVFGGNNKADMAIQPKWHLNSGSIINLYSGGNEGRMTSPAGLLLEIGEANMSTDAYASLNANLKIENVYGGCRKADVFPSEDGTTPATSVSNPDGYSFPNDLAARVLVRGGDINNVYGGNDISGKVYFGNAVGVYTSIRGDVYGGGNGSYAYTDNQALKDDVIWGDFYYDPGESSIDALNAHRPNAEQVSIRVVGTAEKPTVIGGAIYVGGNSATLLKRDDNTDQKAELKIGSYVIADNVFLGNNGVNMVDATANGVLAKYAGKVTNAQMNKVDFSSLDLTKTATFAKYMEGCAMSLRPKVVFDGAANDPAIYKDFSSYFGSFYCGGNVGSMTYSGTNTLNFNKAIYIYNKVVGGCNNAYVPKSKYNDEYMGGIITPLTDAEKLVNPNKLVLNFEGTLMLPKRLKSDGTLEWNTKKWQTSETEAAVLVDALKGDGTDADKLRLYGGNVYGGCYSSGYVNGDVEINIKSDLVKKDEVFGSDNSGVDREEQYNDVLGSALNVFGAGYGANSEIRGNTTINISGGYVFQTFGGGEQGVVTGNCTTTITGGQMEYLYGGGFEGPIRGNTIVNLDGGTIEGVIGGSCNADIQGHTEVYIGKNGFPEVLENVNGGNDFGGTIHGKADFSGKLSEFAKGKVYNSAVTTASAYVEFTQGKVGQSEFHGSIFGGNFGSFNYKDNVYRRYTDPDGSDKEGFTKPRLGNAFVYFKPINIAESRVGNVYGGCIGYEGLTDNNLMQNRSYVLIEIPQSMNNFTGTQVFGAGDYAGLGMGVPAADALTNSDGVTATAVIDLVQGKVKDVFGASYREGITRRTIVNVPVGSTIELNRIFGGAYGLDVDKACDVIESNVNWRSEQAMAKGDPADVDKDGNQTAGGIYGGNNNARRTIFAKVNIYSKVCQNNKGYTGRVFGAGYGANSWARHTEVNLLNGANVYEPYGGGFGGKVLNQASVTAWSNTASEPIPTALGTYTDENIAAISNQVTTPAALDGNTYDANVHVYEGAYVGNYGFGGGLGADAVVSGTTYFDVLGGTVNKDIYGSGTSGDVRNLYEAKDNTTFTASTTVYVKGGTVRNAYGGGWRGSVGYHQGELHETNDNDILGESHVIIGDVNGTDFLHGIPAITRNVYGGGEGGAIYGTANVTINNGYIGYRYENGQYKEELDEPDKGKDGIGTLDESGNVFGGGYVANSYTDISNVNMYGGIVRGCLYGGGEIGPIGRGTVHPDKPAGSFTNGDAKIYKGGETHVTLWKGHVMRDVFGGGRGFDNWNGEGYMTPEENLTMDKSSKGYVFGSTEVRIRGGEVGTREGVQKGYGNVFGGGNVGFVYSATGTKKGERTTIAMEHLTNGLPADGGGYYYSVWNESDMTQCQLSLDCNVVVEPYCEVTADGGFGTHAKGEFVPIEELNMLGNKEASASDWAKIDWETGVTIHNAVFAGGNVIRGSDQVSVNTATVYGNVTAALRDAYNRDLITVGTEHVGGLYGDGNLTFVDGWRELHIDNYGTDYYNNDETITVEKYQSMSDRERAYFVLNYRCKAECTGKNGLITVGTRLTADEFKEAFDYDNYHESTYPADYKNYINEDGTPNPAFFEELGFCSIYAGRLLNTIQRCDMAAIWGSRIVLQGARDRVPEKADYTRYTINRVGELSLNQRTNPSDASSKHGNYFGIYSIVNYLGNLTSDVFFTEAAEHQSAIRKTDSSNPDNKADGTTTYYTWKMNNRNKGNRNNGTSENKVSLASGVYLEIIREESEKAGHTEWGLITGVVQLDLIDVKTGLGGGYVYARNQHGAKTWHQDWDKVNLSPYNLTARTYKRFTYDESSESSLKEIETSGNFVHNTKQIIDDCYPNANAYKGVEKSPAHYWYIRGQIYVYDQYISAYTGSANAYAKTVSIPLTISAASHGKMTLRDVQPNRYAFYDNEGNPLGDNGSVIINEITYKAGDPIDYWSYQTLSATDQSRFVDQVYTTISKCLMSKEGTDTIFANHILLPDEITRMRNAAPKKKVEDGADAPSVPSVYDPEQEKWVDFDFVFRPANNIGHDTGYALTFDFNNPLEWDKYYSLKNGRGADGKLSITTEEYVDKDGTYHTVKDDYISGPTYRPKTSGVYAQRNYTLGEIFPKEIYDNYEANVKRHVAVRNDQAEAEAAFVVVTEFSATDKGGTEHQFYPGSPLYASDYDDAVWSDLVSGGKVAAAKVCTSTLQITDKDYVFAGNLLSPADITSLKQRIVAAELTTDLEADKFLEDYLTNAYYCTKAGLYGGNYFEAGKSYRAIETWNTMSADDRDNFLFNYDALDLLIDPTYGGGYGNKYQYDGYMPGSSTIPQYEGCIPNATKIYSSAQLIDYQAEYVGDGNSDLTYRDKTGEEKTVSRGYDNRIGRKEFEMIPNERAHWSPIIVDKAGDYYVVKQAFIRGDVPYTVGQTIEASVYNALSNDQKTNCIDKITFTGEHAGTKDNPKHYYFCRESYVIGEHGEGVGFTNLGITAAQKTYVVGDRVDANVLIDAEAFDKLVNKQAGFIIHGTAPEETATLYVSRESDINDLQKEKIITVIYLYEYQESDESGNNITPISERHVINLHINFESGVPEIGVLHKPNTVLPGTTVGLKIPTVEPGAFEITSSGWEVFANADDAALHANGQPFYNNSTPVYWYQNDYYVAYYAQTYLGKTYSNAVQFSVANYHDLKKVMDDTQHHYYIDHKDVDREPKIYINDYSSDEQNGLLLFKDLIDLTNNKTVAGHSPLTLDNPGKELQKGNYLEFFLRSNQEFTSAGWTPIANAEGECFSGTLHGDGHYIKGLDNSLFGHLCGDVHNLGVMGSFTSGGIADTGEGYIGNSWVYTTGTPDGTVKAVFGNPSDGRTETRQIENCYYYAAAGDYKQEDTHGKARKMTKNQFYSGEVAYDLNGSYLYKRYYDHVKPASGDYYSYYVEETDAEGNGVLTLKTDGRYGGDFLRYVYVEDRFRDGDFIYADGSIPEEDDIRLHRDEETEAQSYYPIWPDDYIFFGQTLDYGHTDGRTHQDVPSALNRSNGRMLTNADGNRVYRAPAYFRSKQRQMAHFNPYAVFPATEKEDATAEVYKRMTAIDFTGGNGDVAGGYKTGLIENERFFPPLLDYDGLTAFVADGLTRNLLVYADPVGDAYSYEQVLSPALPEATFTINESGKYNEVAVPANANSVKGHLVSLSGSVGDGNYVALRNHYLVDRNDFNAPISYTFGDDYRMWYQRTPERYVDLVKGWEDVCLPFIADIVTTQRKGELTHFFKSSTTGHEYWLRKYDGNVKAKDVAAGVYTAVFNYPAVDGDAEKHVTNSFLWDYYYQGESHNHLDRNSDTYQTYYNNARYYEHYPRLKAATSYIIGFPGSTYYEFDLSGTFSPTTTAESHPEPLAKQVITFASATGATIGVSDDEMNATPIEGLTFKPSYLNQTLEAGRDAFTLNDKGNAYKRIPATGAATELAAFRPYFTGSPSSARTRGIQQIEFGQGDSSFGIEDRQDPRSDEAGTLTIRAAKGRIIVSSSLGYATDVRIVTPAGMSLSTFTVEPGQTIETPVLFSGIYIVRSEDGIYTKKLSVMNQ